MGERTVFVTRGQTSTPGLIFKKSTAHLKLPSIPDTSIALVIIRVRRNGT